jgi:2-(1,2-epoxy-1,2-dihydrophenyl)acetyl-CoA isomerase
MLSGRFRGFEVTLHELGIVLVTLNQPDRLNGTTQPMKRDLIEILLQAQMDDDVRVVVVTGTGRAFCAGDDISGKPCDYGDAQSLAPDIGHGHNSPMGTYAGLRALSQSLNLAVRNLDKISIAAINGIAIQTGLSLALSCDFRVASTEARLGGGTLRFGLLPDEGGHFLVTQLVGPAKAMDFFMRNRMLDGREALDWGLVHEVVPADELTNRTMELARELAEGPQAAMRVLKRAIYTAAQTSFEQSLDDIATKTAITDHHPDAREGVVAFREKRKPEFNRVGAGP